MGCSNSKEVIHAVQGTAETVQAAGQRVLEHGGQRARNVFAKPLMDLFAANDGAKPPYFAKTDAELKFLKAALPKNFCFEQVSEHELQQMVDCMEQITIEAGQDIIRQGTDGDFFYVIYSGSVHYTVDGEAVGSGVAGDSFGELSLLYTTPRAATVTADSNGPVVLYRVDQLVFRYILQQQSLTETQAKIAVLKKVAFFTNNLDDYSVHKIANVMTSCDFPAGTVIVKKGDTDANHFYILVHGAVQCTEVGVGDGDACQYQNVTLDNPGDVFGERALITGEPRAATVTATKETRCYTIDKLTFESMLGDFHAAITKANDVRHLVRSVNMRCGGSSDELWACRCGVCIVFCGYSMIGPYFIFRFYTIHHCRRRLKLLRIPS